VNTGKNISQDKPMKIIISKPPQWIWDECVKRFGIDKRKGVVFTVGENLYNPDNVVIPDHLYEHELTHAKQHEYNDTVATLWWKRYFEDPKFRCEQEVEAYSKQYQFICTKIKDKNARYRALHQLAVDLAGDMYGRSISYTDAIRRIRGN